MPLQLKPLAKSLASTGLVTLALGLPGAFAATPCSPCGARNRSSRAGANPCAARNPCAAKNPCGARNPCGASGKVDPKLVTRPKGTKPYRGKRADLVKAGRTLWNDTKLSTNGLACNTCHINGAAFQATFAKPYPHYVAMTDQQAGLKKVTAEEMVQLCMVVPMAAKPLAWDSKQLAALTAYTVELQKNYKHNPCAAKNPCTAKNPCAGRNPCAAKNPCAGRNPCASRNPCGPRNPCAAKR